MAKKPLSGAYPKHLVTLGDHLRKRRLDLNLFQKDVAAMLGVDTMTVNNWERSRCGPTLQAMPSIVEFLGYSPFPVTQNPSIIEAIKAYRLMHGLSQKKLATILRIDPATLAQWENGTSKPGATLKKRLVGCLSTSDDTPQLKPIAPTLDTDRLH